MVWVFPLFLQQVDRIQKEWFNSLQIQRQSVLKMWKSGGVGVIHTDLWFNCFPSEFLENSTQIWDNKKEIWVFSWFSFLIDQTILSSFRLFGKNYELFIKLASKKKENHWFWLDFSLFAPWLNQISLKHDCCVVESCFFMKLNARKRISGLIDADFSQINGGAFWIF